MYWLSKHGINHLHVDRSELSCKVSPWSVIVIKPVLLEIPPLLRDNLCFTFTQLLVFFNPFVLVDSVHELA